jgi:Fe-S cluster biosynthesis and repair protein YggX
LADKVKLHRRIASQSKWSYQERGAVFLAETERLKAFQKQCRKLLNDMDELTREQLELQESGYFDPAQREGVLRLMAEIHASLIVWHDATEEQQDLVGQRRLELALAKDRKQKSEEKYRAAVVELQNVVLAVEAKELEDIYVNSFRRRVR